MPNILVTGCSTGFGRAIAIRFAEEGWHVAATMRQPQPELFAGHERVRVLPLDVTDERSIAEAVAAAGPIDALVNNAGVGLLNVLEGTAMESARLVFETNVLGAIAMARAVMPQFRERRSGVVVNVSSSVTLKPLPALSVYSASKAAINAFTQSLALEAELFGVRARLVLPGSAPETAFGKNAMARMGFDIPEPYSGFVHAYLAELRGSGLVTTADDVAEAVWHAVTEPAAPMCIAAGADAEAWMHQAQPAAR
jgi:NAD(P)-dependent dehydrogenase (short-subunit alcohol dehydrogenase family)